MTDEAAAILDEALKTEAHASEVESALAAISDRTEGEQKSEVKVLTEASAQREFSQRGHRARHCSFPDRRNLAPPNR